MSLILPITPTSLPQGFCPATYQEMWNEFAAHGNVTIPTGVLSGISVSATKPTDQTRPWLQLDDQGRPLRLFWFAIGSWLSLHPLRPGMTIWWFEALPSNMNTFDGGDAGAESAVTGPMWRQAKTPDGTLIAAMFPIAAGTLPSTTVLAVGDLGGEEKHSLTIPEMPPHTHNNGYWTFSDGHEPGPDHGFTPDGETDDAEATSKSTGGVAGVVTPHNTMPPYVVGYLLQRTPLREYYSIPP